MSFRAFLLRLLLCLGLVVNGSSQAVAMTHSVVGPHQAVVATPTCHEADDMNATGSQVHVHRRAPVTKKSGCCTSGTCECAFGQGAVATMSAVLATGRKVRHAALVGLPLTRYDSPALPRLIRPPIV